MGEFTHKNIDKFVVKLLTTRIKLGLQSSSLVRYSIPVCVTFARQSLVFKVIIVEKAHIIIIYICRKLSSDMSFVGSSGVSLEFSR